MELFKSYYLHMLLKSPQGKPEIVVYPLIQAL